MKNLSKINEFLNLSSFALAGASAKKKKFGNEILKQMLARGMNVMPVHKTAEVIDGTKCYANLNSLPIVPEGVILSISPAETEKMVEEIHALGIRNIWIQQGAESKKAIDFCEKNKLNVVHGNCILMFLDRSGFPHNIHKWIWSLGAKA